MRLHMPKNTENEQLAMFVATHAAVGKLLVCKRKQANAIGTYCDSEDE